MSNAIKSKCPHCLRTVELHNGKLKAHLAPSGKVCEPKRTAVETAGQYSGYKKRT